MGKKLNEREKEKVEKDKIRKREDLKGDCEERNGMEIDKKGIEELMKGRIKKRIEWRMIGIVEILNEIERIRKRNEERIDKLKIGKKKRKGEKEERKERGMNVGERRKRIGENERIEIIGIEIEIKKGKRKIWIKKRRKKKNERGKKLVKIEILRIEYDDGVEKRGMKEGKRIMEEDMGRIEKERDKMLWRRNELKRR